MRFHGLSHEDPPNRSQTLIPVEELEIPRELLDAVDLTPTLDLDRDDVSFSIATEEIDRSDRRRMLPSRRGWNPTG